VRTTGTPRVKAYGAAPPVGDGLNR
jgi:hypothetical protein